MKAVVCLNLLVFGFTIYVTFYLGAWRLIGVVGHFTVSDLAFGVLFLVLGMGTMYPMVRMTEAGKFVDDRRKQWAAGANFDALKP